MALAPTDLIGSDLQCLIHILKNELVMVQLKAVSLMGMNKEI